jgi:hypothetical protein
MKTLATCNPREFLAQTNKIRKAVKNWLSMTKIMEIRKNLPEVKEGATQDEKRAALYAQISKNATAILDSIMDDHPDETVELLGLMCFVEPDDLENHKMTEFLAAFTELVNCPEVIGFFTSLMQLEKMGTSDSAKV